MKQKDRRWVEYGFIMCRGSRGSGSLDSVYWPNTVVPADKKIKLSATAHRPGLLRHTPPDVKRDTHSQRWTRGKIAREGSTPHPDLLESV